jgi:predicted chitinase
MARPTAVTRIRKLAARHNLLLEKSLIRNRDTTNDGDGWRLRTRSGITLMGENFTANLEDIEAFLVHVTSEAVD